MNDVLQNPCAATDMASCRPRWQQWSGSGHVLVVDDSEPVRNVVSHAVTKLGFTADLAADGAQALSLFTANPGLYTLALVDLVLPGGMSGIDIVRELRLRRPDIPVVLTSGCSTEEAKEAVARTGAVEFLQKPFKLESLASALRSALNCGARASKAD